MPKFNDYDDEELARLANASDPEDSDFDIHASSSRSPKKKPRGAVRAPKPKGRRRGHASYGSDDDDDDEVVEEEWSEEEDFFDDEEEQVEKTKSGRPARNAAKKTRTYEESESEEASMTDSDEDEDTPPPSKSHKGGKKPGARSQFAGKQKGGRRGRAAAAIEDSEDEDEDDAAEEPQQVNTPSPKKRTLVVKLKTPGRQFRQSSQQAETQRRSTRLHHEGDLVKLTDSGHHALPQEEEAAAVAAAGQQKGTRSKTASPKGRASRSRSTGLRDRNTPAPAARRVTRAGSAALRNSVPPPDAEERDGGEDHNMDEVIAKIEPEEEDNTGMSRITEEASLLSSSMNRPSEHESSRNGLTNGTTSIDKGDGSFQPGDTTTSTSNANSLAVPISQREANGLLVAKELGEDQQRRTRSSVVNNTQTEADAAAGGNENDAMDLDDDEQPVSNRRRLTRLASRSQLENAEEQAPSPGRKAKGKKKVRKGSDDESYEEDNNESGSEEESDHGASKSGGGSNDDLDNDDELLQEAAELGPRKRRNLGGVRTPAHGSFNTDETTTTTGRPSRRAAARNTDYRLFRPETFINEESSPPPTVSNTNRGKRGGNTGFGFHSLFSTVGPFGGINQSGAVLGVNKAAGMGGADSDSSDDEGLLATGGAGGPLSSGGPRNSISGGRSSIVGPGGTPANLGKITGKQKQLLADADPLGVDPNVDFTQVGGLSEHIDQLKEMVALPLTYPEIFKNLGVTPPRGVLFHGPPGTGKTLMARALAASCSSESRKISFYMRKGADCLSKWVGEAERQLRLLFEEARANQPSIIFFDEIDGLAPVRSSKQEQIHASIVSTLLALMDGMDGRGQVIVIGATNRPDSVDPALRRPGRFDREFYFPLPSKEARRSIIEIHTKSWPHPPSNAVKDHLASLTKGYGGADLRALCTEAALNAIQRTYPQIYKDATKKFLIDSKSIDPIAADFMISLKKITPSSERSTTSGAVPLPEHIQPLLGPVLAEIKEKIAKVLPKKKQLTALEEAEFEQDVDPDGGFAREMMYRDFESSTVFRPRLLVHGASGMGQNYIGGAVLHHFEGFHVQTLNLPTLMGDPTRTPEAALVQIFVELKRHKPSVLFIPDIDNWYSSITMEVQKTFEYLLNSISPSEAILLFGITSQELHLIDSHILRDFFGYSKKSRVPIPLPKPEQRGQYFQNVLGHIKKTPRDFPDPANRRKRKLAELPVAPPPPERPLTKEEKAAIAKQERYLFHQLKCKLLPHVDMLKKKYRRFRRPMIPYDKVKKAHEQLEQQNAGEVVGSDLGPATYDGLGFTTMEDGVSGVVDVQSGKAYYNLDLEVIDDRCYNGYYKNLEMFKEDIQRIIKDANTLGEKQGMHEGAEMFTNVDIFLMELEMIEPAFFESLKKAREDRLERERKKAEAKRRKLAENRGTSDTPFFTNLAPFANSTIPQKRRHGDMMLAPQTPIQQQQQMQRQMMETLPEETSTTSNGYIASSEMGNQSKSGDSDGDLFMSDHGSNQTIQAPQDQQPQQQQAGGSQQSVAFHTAQSQNLQQQTQDGNQPFTISGVVQSQTQQNLTQRSGRALSSTTGLSVAVTSSQKMFDAATGNASTTTSGKKTTDDTQSSGLSGRPIPRPEFPQESVPLDFAHSMPDINFGTPAQGDSQLPDTQVIPSSESSGNASQAFAQQHMTQQHILHAGGYSSQPNSHPSQNSPIVPIVNAHAAQHHLQSLHSNINNNDNPLAGPSNAHLPPPPPKDPPLLLDEDRLQALQDELVRGTNEYTIEQLEQVNASLMDLVWRNKNSWDRNKIIDEAKEVMSEVFDDIKEFNALVALGKRQDEEASQRVGNAISQRLLGLV